MVKAERIIYHADVVAVSGVEGAVESQNCQSVAEFSLKALRSGRAP